MTDKERKQKWRREGGAILLQPNVKDQLRLSLVLSARRSIGSTITLVPT
jgi:hypothetical protein